MSQDNSQPTQPTKRTLFKTVLAAGAAGAAGAALPPVGGSALQAPTQGAQPEV